MRWRSAAITTTGGTTSTCVQELGIQFLRYGPPLHRTTWRPKISTGRLPTRPSPICAVGTSLPITDLCHFGVPDWIGNFQNPDFPDLFAAIRRGVRRAVFRGCSSIRRSTRCSSAPLFSARYGWWNEQLTTDRAFVTALKHIVQANVLAMQAILDVRPDAIFIQSESSEYFHADNPAAIKSGRDAEREAVPVAGSELRPARRFRDVRVPDGQRHDAGRIPLLPRTTS